MDEERFWALMERSYAVDSGEQESKLAAVLGELSPTEIIAFDQKYDELSKRAYRWDIWAVAYWIHGGCSDDSFSDFRARLIGMGRDVYRAALESPDALTAFVDRPEDLFAEGLKYVPRTVYEEKTGGEMPHYDRTAFPELANNFDHDDVDAMRSRFPRLLARLPTCGGADE